MKVSLMLLAGLALVAASHYHYNMDKPMCEKQKFFLDMFYRVHEPLLMKEYESMSDKLVHEKDMFKKFDKDMVHFVEHFHSGKFLHRGEFFSIFNFMHINEVKGLFKLFYYAKDFEVFKQVVVWARIHLNEGLFVYALNMVAIHHPDYKYIVIPSLYEILPHMFYNGKFVMSVNAFEFELNDIEHKVEQKYADYLKEHVHEYDHVQHKKWKHWVGLEKSQFFHDMHIMPVHEKKVFSDHMEEYNKDPHYVEMMKEIKMYWLRHETTDSFGVMNDEAKLNYLTEDFDWNMYWYYSHMRYPFWMDSEEFGFKKEHFGEFFLFNLQQILARYHMERLSQLRMDKDEKITTLSRQIEEATKEHSSLSAKAAGDASAVDELRTQLARADIEMEELRKQLENERSSHKSELVQASDKYVDEKAVLQKNYNDQIVRAINSMLDKCDQDLPNSTSISFPPHLAQSAVTSLLSSLNVPATSPSDVIMLGHNLTNVVLCCASGAYTASIQHFDEVNEQCSVVLSSARKAFTTNPYNSDIIQKEIGKLSDLMMSLPLQTDVDKDVVGSELEMEMRRMDEAIRQAVEQIQAIQQKARENSEGVRLEVNQAILATCQALMNAIMRLVASSREMQMEIVAAGRGGASPAEFYKRNHQWTEGLLSAAKAVGVAAHYLVQSADGVVTGQGKFEQLIVAAQEISASTAQLFVSSRVKADRDSKKLAELSVASRDVNQCTAQVVASVKSGQTTLNEKDILDFSHLTLHGAKKEEMESQVRMLELEQALNVEKARLRELRKQHYHMANVTSNKDGDEPFELLG